jgi:PAS domain-containing protein
MPRNGSYAHSWNKRLTPAQRPSSSRGQQLRRYPPIDQNAACERPREAKPQLLTVDTSGGGFGDNPMVRCRPRPDPAPVQAIAQQRAARRLCSTATPGTFYRHVRISRILAVNRSFPEPILRLARSENRFWQGRRHGGLQLHGVVVFHLRPKEVSELRAKLAALDKSQAVVEFTVEGVIFTANDNFLATLGYELSEVAGKHHSMFVKPVYRDSAEYAAF